MRSSEVITLGFDGAHRCGKGTQIALMEQLLDEHHIPHITVRGDGRREGIGGDYYDSTSPYWQGMFRRLSTEPSEELWTEAAHELAYELIKRRVITLPRIIEQNGSRVGVLLVDRSLLSRAVIPQKFGRDNLYYDDKITEAVTPDRIFHLQASQAVLLERLTPDDPKYSFRRLNIVQDSGYFQTGLNLIPEPLRGRVIDIDGEQPPVVVHQAIRELVSPLFEYTGHEL